jgi:hypothetical protein
MKRADLVCLTGFGLLLYGEWLIHPAIAFVTGGVGMIALGTTMFKKSNKAEPKS